MEGGVAGASHRPTARLPPAGRIHRPYPCSGRTEGRGGPGGVPPELGWESETKEGKVRKGCTQISLAAPRLCWAWGLFDSGRAPPGHREGCSRVPTYRRAVFWHADGGTPSAPFNASPSKSRSRRDAGNSSWEM